MLMRNDEYQIRTNGQKRMLEVEAKLIAYRSGWLQIERPKIHALQAELATLLDDTNPPTTAPARALLN